MKKDVHLVIDAGSSGTRFCLYELKKDVTNNTCNAKNVEGSYNKCKSIPAANGIADLKPEEGLEVIKNGLNEIESYDPILKQKIFQSTLIGTGGFRRYLPEKYLPTIEAINQYFEKENIYSTTKVISGDEEAKFAWLSAKHFPEQFKKHGILEIGGATVQVAFEKSSENNNSNLVTFSDKIGSNVSFDKLSLIGVFNRFCEQPVVTYKNDLFSECKKFVYNNIFRRSELKKFVRKQPLPNDVKFYGMGGSWHATFRIIKQDKITKKEFMKLGHSFCGMGQQEIETIYGIPSKYAERQCYTFAYQTALMDTLKIDSIYNGKGESYTKGVSTSSEFLKTCGVEK